MTQFKEGQEVEVACWDYEWRRARIVKCDHPDMPHWYEVAFPDSTRAILDEERIRAVDDYELARARFIEELSE